MSTRDEVLERLMRVARALGPLVDEVVLVGGCVPATYDLSKLAAAQRPTDDVDLLVDAQSQAEYYELTARMKKVTGMTEWPEGGVICRYEMAGELVDLMPTSAEVLSFGNLWYAEAMETAEWHELAPGLRIRVAQPACFLATKLEALADRGMDDLILSQDLEDIVSVLIGLPWLASDIRQGGGALHAFIRERMCELLASEDVQAAWEAHSGTDAQAVLIGRVARDEMLIAAHSRSGLRRVRVQLESGGLAFSVPRLSLAWSLDNDPNGDRLLAQARVDERLRAGEKSLLNGARCWALDPTNPQGERIPVSLAACECELCLETEGPSPLPCLNCSSCLAEAAGTCEDCGLEARAFPETGEAAGSRVRSGYLLTRSAACEVHDHQRCVRRWEFQASGLTHVAACGCSCHRG